MGSQQTFSKGQRIRAVVEEVLSEKQLLISLDGRLLRISNFSAKTFKKSDTLELIVMSVHPLEFKLYSDYLKGSDRFA